MYEHTAEHFIAWAENRGLIAEAALAVLDAAYPMSDYRKVIESADSWRTRWAADVLTLVKDDHQRDLLRTWAVLAYED